jgi:acetyl/propionyl-CoA carboxylase alpha subunit/acetyl-CoA carboxylase carboxyltransferase component
MNREFRRIAIVNRGEPAMRLLHAVREYSREHDLEMCTIALYTEPDAGALFVREADEAVLLGPATWTDPSDGSRKSTYLDLKKLERVLTEIRADAVWVGWGFVAERPEFVDLCRRLGIVFIGPSAGVMRRLGDKITSKRLAEQARVPVAPWSGGPVDTLEEAREHAQKLGYPLMIKATAGGGGRGIRRVTSDEELEESFTSARSEALKAFGDATVFLERALVGARHVEVQIIADHHGNTWAAGLRDCSVQRRNQKVIEESASTALTPHRDRRLREAAVRLCKAAGYTNAGTVEFLYDPRQKKAAFMEVNARLQVEHPVTEMTTGLDLVKLQLHVARGGRLEGRAPEPSGHAIEVRLCAEDPDNRFAPAPGRIELLRLPAGPGVRVDSGFEEGDAIAPEFDSMIAKIIVHGRDREEALARLRRALVECTVLIRGGTSNAAFLLELAEREEVARGDIHIGWLDESVAELTARRRPLAEVALIQAAIEVSDAERDADLANFLYAAHRGRPQARSEIGRTADLRLRGQAYKLRVLRQGSDAYKVLVDGATVLARVERLGRFRRRLHLGGRTYRIATMAEGFEQIVEVDGLPHRVSRDDGGVVRSSAPAVVVAVRTRPGAEVAAGDVIAVLEAMKMELPLVAPFAGKVREVFVAANDQVAAGAPLLQLEPLETRDERPAAERLEFTTLSPPASGLDPLHRALSVLCDLRALVLGYDAEPSGAGEIFTARDQLAEKVPADEERLVHEERELLERFADIAWLSRRDPVPDDDDPGTPRRSPQEMLFTYLRALDTGGEGLPATFLAQLERALRHYGVTGRERTPELEEALLCIAQSHTRLEAQVASMMAILDRHLQHAERLADPQDPTYRRLLGRLTEVSQGRFAALEDLAREVRFELYDRPLLEQSRREVYAQVDEHLAQLARHPHAGDRNRHIETLIGCPQPLTALLVDRYRDVDLGMQQTILEALTRRYYRIRQLENLRMVVMEGQSVAFATYEHDGRSLRVVSTYGTTDGIEQAGQLIVALLAEVAEDREVLVDLFLHDDGSRGGDGLREHLEQTLDAAGFPPSVRRVVVTTTGPRRGHGEGGLGHHTYRRAEDGHLREDALLRGLHPMTAKRLQLWRLESFHIERLPSAEDVFLFRGVARDNPQDERLFAVAEVRDLTPRRDENGRLQTIPSVERVFLEVLAAIRLHQSRRLPHERLFWNRILLYVWPPVELERREVQRVALRLAPATRGLGVEKVVVRAQMPAGRGEELEDVELHVSNPMGRGLSMKRLPPSDRPIRPLTPYWQKVLKLRRRGLHHPYEIVRLLAGEESETGARFPRGEFVEHDLDEEGRLVPVSRPWGQNRANVVVGIVRNFTERYPEGMTRVVVLGDPARGLGSLAAPECSRIIGALDLAERLGVPVEWFAVSAGAKIAMDSGTENMDWIGLVLRRIVLFTQAGGEINVIVHGVNVGAQPYWNAEATMLMHTRGILIMTPEAAMVLTGKKALDYSGSVSAEDNHGIGGYDRVMGPNGQAQYWAADITAACRTLLRHYDHSYVAPGESFPRRAHTLDPVERDVCEHRYEGNSGTGFETIGDVFSPEKNPGRKRPFEIRRVMKAVIDQDHAPLERWSAMRDAEVAVVWDAHLGGYPVCLLGIESRPLPRSGFVPADGPEQWSAGTLFPQSSKKIARALNSASGNRPAVVLANLSGFDGSPESMRNLQLEFGAEIGRAVVNFRGPMVFCVVSRYHGGAFVVFSRTLNENLEVAALENTHASVIGGAPAAAVVFAREVDQRTRRDPRVEALEAQVRGGSKRARARAAAQLPELMRQVRSEKLGEVAEEFDRVHNVQRALDVGSVSRILPPEQLRPYLVDALARGIASTDGRLREDRPFPDWRHLMERSGAGPREAAPPSRAGADAVRSRPSAARPGES